MATTRTEILSALELAALVMPAADRAATYRTEFIELLAMDPGMVGSGRGRRAARILSAMVMALRERNSGPSSRVLQGDHEAAGQGHQAITPKPKDGVTYYLGFLS
jgi:hypothetical protein